MTNPGNQTSYYGISDGFDEPYLYGNASVPISIPGYMDISIGGHPYLAETSFEPYRRDAYRSDSIPTLAEKIDLTNIPGEASVNSEGLWRRAMQDFSSGAGQQFLDRQHSVDNRFLASKGVNPWTPWQASLLNDTQQVVASTTITQVMTVGSRVYIVDNGTLKFSSSVTTWAPTTVTGYPANSVSYIATDGFNIYAACGTNGIYIGPVTGSTLSSWVTGTVDYVWYVSGLVLCAHANLLYNPVISTTDGPTALTTAGPAGATSLLTTNQNANFVYNTACAGNSWIYVGGYTTNSGSNISLIYKTQVNTTFGTALTVPVVAATLPGGELAYTLYAYTNYILLGTSLGARFCETLGVNDPGGNNGDLKMGPIVPDLIQQVNKPVRAFTGQFRFIWFGWSNYDEVSTGIGRMDLSTFIDAQSPAYTSDLMVTGTGEVLSMDWFNGAPSDVSDPGLIGAPVFVIGGSGLYTAAATLVPEGIIDSGFVSYGIPDRKIPVYFSFNVSGSGSVGAFISVDSGRATSTVPMQNLSNLLVEQQLPTNLGGELFDIQVQMTPNETSTAGPVLTRWTMKALNAVVSGTQHKVIINLFKQVQTYGPDQATNPYVEFDYLDGLRKSANPVSYIEGTQFGVTVVVKAVTRLIYNKQGLPYGGFNSRLEVTLQTLEN